MNGWERSERIRMNWVSEFCRVDSQLDNWRLDRETRDQLNADENRKWRIHNWDPHSWIMWFFIYSFIEWKRLSDLMYVKWLKSWMSFFFLVLRYRSYISMLKRIVVHRICPWRVGWNLVYFLCILLICSYVIMLFMIMIYVVQDKKYRFTDWAVIYSKDDLKRFLKIMKRLKRV